MGEAMKGGSAWTWVVLGAAMLTLSCDRDYDSPYLPGSPGYAGDDWTRDDDRNGVADSVEKYAPDCRGRPEACIGNAKALSRISEWRLRPSDMILPEGSRGVPPRLAWEPAEASLKGFALTSADTAKVRVRDGLMDAVGVGNAQVLVAVPGAERMAFFVKVVPQGARRVAGISAEDLTAESGTEIRPRIAWSPEDAAHKDYQVTVDDPLVGWPDGSGLLKAVYPGTARVTVEALDGGHKAVFTLKVTEAATRVEATSIAAEDMYLVIGAGPEAPVIRWTPADVTEKRYLLAPAETSIVTVDRERARLVPLAPGRTQVGIFSLDGGNRTAWFTVHVAREAVPVQGLSATDLNLTESSKPTEPRLAWVPAEATNRKYALVSDSPHVAAAEGGFIVPKSLGTAVFRATTVDGGFQGVFVVKVVPNDTTVHVDSVRAEDMSITAGFDQEPRLSWYPADVGNQGYSLSSSDPAVATVSGGLVRGVAAGNAVLTVTTEDGQKTATFKVNVAAPHIPVQSIKGENLDLVVGAIETPALSWLPGNATNRGYSLVSLSPDVARVSGGGAVEAVSVGSAAVVVRSADGPTDTLQVVVQPKPIPVTGIALATLNLNVGDPDKDVAPHIQWTPLNATTKSFRLISTSNPAAALIAANMLRPVASGSASVVVESQDTARLRATFTVLVRQPVKGVTVRDTAVWPGSAEIDPVRLIAWTPSNADNKDFLLSSLDTTVASIVGGNRVRPRKSGAANVILKSLENPLRQDTFKVTVKVPVISVSVRDTTVKVGARGVSVWPNITFTPGNATDKNHWVEWVGPANSSILTMPNTWQFDAMGPGVATIAVFSVQNPAARDTIKVTVLQPVASIMATGFAMKVGDADASPILAWNPTNASDKGYALTSGNTAVATAVGGKVHAVGPGSAVIQARTNDGGRIASFTVTVTQPVSSVSAQALSMKVGDADRDPVLTWVPSNASNKGYSLASGASSVVSIVSGKLHAAGAGTATVTVTTSDGGKTAQFAVTVVQPVLSITAKDLVMTKGDADRDLDLTWNPTNASNKGFTLTGGDPNIAVPSGIKVKAVGGGATRFTVTTSDGGKVASFNVTVKVPVAAVEAGDMEMRIDDPDRAPILAWTPADATDKGYVLTSSNPETASIVAGKVHAVSRGSATITVTTSDGGKADTFTVQVRGASILD